MARPLDAARRAELLDLTLRYAAEHGLADLSLRPLAESLGTSARMLVHYFGSKEQLIGLALAASRPDVSALVARDEPAPQPDLARLAEALWADLTGGGPQEPRVRLLLEVMALALTQPDRYGAHAREAIDAWVDPLTLALGRSGAPADEASARATALVSGLRGLALDRYLTGDVTRTDRAASLLITAMMA